MITGEVLGTSRDERKNIIIWIAFEKDGTPVEFYDGDGLITFKGRKAWPLYSTHENFDGRTEAQARDWIRKNIEYQIGNIIKFETASEKLISDAETLVSSFVGEKFQTDKTSFRASLANNGVPDATIEITESGVVTVK